MYCPRHYCSCMLYTISINNQVDHVWKILDQKGDVLDHYRVGPGSCRKVLDDVGEVLDHVGEVLDHVGVVLDHAGEVLDHAGRSWIM